MTTRLRHVVGLAAAILLLPVVAVHANSPSLTEEGNEIIPPVTKTGGLYSPPGNWVTQRGKNSNILLTRSVIKDVELAITIFSETHEVSLVGVAYLPDVHDFSLIFPDMKITLPPAPDDFPVHYSSNVGPVALFAKSIPASDLPAVIHDLTKQDKVEIVFSGRHVEFSLIGSSSAIGTLAKAAEDQGTSLPRPFNPFPSAPKTQAMPQPSDGPAPNTPDPKAFTDEISEPAADTSSFWDWDSLIMTAEVCGGIGFLAILGMGISALGKHDRKLKSDAQKERQRLQDLYNQRINTGFDAIREHARTLGLKRWQLISYDDYGTPQYGKWYREIDYFLNTVIWTLPALQGINRQANPQLDENYRKAIIQAAAANQPNQNGDIPFSDDMDPYAYERACAQVLTNEGWNARATVGSGDQGADVTAERNGIRIVLQCKLYSNAVPNSAVQQVAAARLHYAAQYAAVVSNARYTASAQQLARTTNVTLLHHDQLAAWAASLNGMPDNVEPIRA
ncbi:restriction endonuclease [Gluconacetobacter entanii]|nr:restriction endonuclease [Gluconacetobacter entanii]MCW4589617.1 restriction endonuclease [Gluconacetobacter entanii]MCW4592931.1 restriction endonuclease [Gluconacetobacter entanii]